MLRRVKALSGVAMLIGVMIGLLIAQSPDVAAGEHPGPSAPGTYEIRNISVAGEQIGILFNTQHGCTWYAESSTEGPRIKWVPIGPASGGTHARCD